MKYHEKVWVPPVQWSPGISLGQLRANLAVNGPQLYIGRDGHGLVWAGTSKRCWSSDHPGREKPQV